MRVLSLFDGMACGHIALTEMGVPIGKYDAYEIDKYAIQTATHNFPDIVEKGNVFDEDFSRYEGGYDLLIGGSPCTYWSIAQKNNRETEASGMGWELFSQYVRALKEVKPKYFLYENNKSMSKAIKQSISDAFGFEPILINSALVSAQNRQRLYWCGIRQDDGTYRKADIEQPEDRGILLKDILEDGIVAKDKAYCLKHQSGNARDYFKKHHTDIKFEPIIMNYPHGYNKGGAKYDKSPTLTANGDWQDNNKVVEPVCADGEKGKTLTSSYYKYAASDSFKKANPRMGIAEPVGTTADDKSYAVTAYYSTGQNAPHTLEKHKGTMVAEPINTYNDEKAQGGGAGGKTGLYAIPTEFDENDKPIKAKSLADGKIYTVYDVKNGLITIKGKQYPIKLKDGYYIIRKLTVKECMRLQTVPEWYEFIVSDTQAYKMLGNGWTVEVIKHLLKGMIADDERRVY